MAQRKVFMLYPHRAHTKRGGIQTHIERLVAYAANEYEIDILDKESAYTLSLGRQMLAIPRMSVVRKILRSGGIVHAHGFANVFVYTYLLSILPLLRWTGGGVVLTLHAHPFESQARPLLAKYFFRFLSKRIIERADHVFFITDKEREYVVDELRVKINSISFLLNGVDVRRGELERVVNPESLVLFVGRGDPVKRPNVYFQLAKLLKNCGARFCYVSQQPPQTSSSEVVDWMPSLQDSDLNELYERAKVLVLPSRYEAFGIVALEALSHGCAVVCSSEVGLLELVEPSDAIRVVRYESETELEEYANAVSAYLNMNADEFLKVQKQAIKIAADFSWEKIVSEQYVPILNALLNRKIV